MKEAERSKDQRKQEGKREALEGEGEKEKEAREKQEWLENELAEKFGLGQNPPLTAEELKEAQETIVSKEQERAYSRALQKKEDALKELRVQNAMMKAQAEELRERLQDVGAQLEDERTARMEERHGCERMQSSFENKLERARADAVEQAKGRQRTEVISKAREKEAATLAGTLRTEVEDLRRELVESRGREGNLRNRIRTLEREPVTDGKEGQGEQSRGDAPPPQEPGEFRPIGGPARDPSIGRYLTDRLGELRQITPAVGPGATELPDQRAATAPGPKVKAPKAVKAVTKPKVAPNKPKATARVKGPPSARTTRSTGAPPLAPENTRPVGSATSDESKGDKESEGEPVGLEAPLGLGVPPGPEEPMGLPAPLLPPDAPVGVPPLLTGMEGNENGDPYDFNDSESEVAPDDRGEGTPDDKGEGDPEPEV